MLKTCNCQVLKFHFLFTLFRRYYRWEINNLYKEKKEYYLGPARHRKSVWSAIFYTVIVFCFCFSLFVEQARVINDKRQYLSWSWKPRILSPSPRCSFLFPSAPGGSFWIFPFDWHEPRADPAPPSVTWSCPSAHRIPRWHLRQYPSRSAVPCSPGPFWSDDLALESRATLQTLALANVGSGSDQSWQLRERGRPDWENILIKSIRMKTVDKVWDYPESGLQTNFIKRHNINWISM